MTRVRSDQVAIFLTVVVSVLAACGGVSEATQSPPTETPAEPTATPRPSATPTEPPSMPQPGATFSGPMTRRTSGEYTTVAAVELELTITANGSAVASVGLSMRNTRCTNDTGSVTIESGGRTSTMTPAQPFTVANGEFEFSIAGLTASGQFTSPTEATATVELTLDERVGMGSTITCDYGSWDWSGTAQ